MAQPTKEILRDAMAYGTGVTHWVEEMFQHVPLTRFWLLPEPGERDPWEGRYWWRHDAYDDGGGPALAAYRFGRCIFKD